MRVRAALMARARAVDRREWRTTRLACGAAMAAGRRAGAAFGSGARGSTAVISPGEVAGTLATRSTLLAAGGSASGGGAAITGSMVAGSMVAGSMLAGTVASGS